MLSLKQLRKLYSEYSFIPQTGALAPVGWSVAEAGDYDTWSPLLRSYEDQKWYFIVFAPLDVPYLKDPDWYQAKGVDSAQKWCNSKTKHIKRATAYYITRELASDDVAKTHINILCVSPTDLMYFNRRFCYHKYSIFVTVLDRPQDRNRIFRYINKERKHRTFVKYLDYQNSK